MFEVKKDILNHLSATVLNYSCSEGLQRLTPKKHFLIILVTEPSLCTILPNPSGYANKG